MVGELVVRTMGLEEVPRPLSLSVDCARRNRTIEWKEMEPLTIGYLSCRLPSASLKDLRAEPCGERVMERLGVIGCELCCLVDREG
jgi:hypothetical protein